MEILTQINSGRLMTKQSWTERSWFPISKLCVLLLKLDWNRSTKTAVDSNCWLEAQGQWSNVFRLPRSSKIALSSIPSVLMWDPFSDNLGYNLGNYIGDAKVFVTNWGNQRFVTLLVAHSVCRTCPCYTQFAVFTPHPSAIFVSRSWGWIPWKLMGFKAFTNQPNASV